MAPKKMPWFRFYVEAVHDRKLRRLKPEHRWLFVTVLAAARDSHIEGFLMLSEKEPLATEDLADMASLPIRTVDAGMTAMSEAGLIEWDPNLRCWSVTNWRKRQYPSDRSTDRVAEHRRSNGDVTAYRPPKGDEVTPPENREQKTDTETDPSSHSQSVELALVNPPPLAARSDFEQWWSAYPRKVAKKAAKAKYAVAAKRVDPCVLYQAVREHAYNWERYGYEAQFIPHPATWLEQGRWEDDPPGPRSNGRQSRTAEAQATIRRSLARMEGGAS